MIAPKVSKDFEQWLSKFRPGVSDDRPRYRVVFGATERDHLGRHKYVNPNGGLMEFWILEQWQKPEFFGTPEEWNKDRFFYDDVHQTTIDVKGAYPSRGKYVMTLPLTENGSFIPLTEQLKDEIAIRIRANEAFAYMMPDERTASLHENHAKEERLKMLSLEDADGERDEYYKSNWERLNRQGTRGYSVTPR